MGQTVKAWWKVCKDRWKSAMPKFFKVVMTICALVGGTAIAINTAFQALGVTPHDWWNDILPYIIGFSVGGGFIAKFTKERGKIDVPHITGYDKEQHMED